MSSSAIPPTPGRTGPIPLGGTSDMALQAGLRMNGVAASRGRNPNVAVDDWDLMFEAVRSRLRRTVGEYPGERSAAVPPLSPSLVQATVLDCVRALDQLHAALEQERSQRPTS